MPPRHRAGAMAIAAAVALNAGAVALLWSASPELPIRGDVIYDWVVARQLLHGRGLTTTLMPLSGMKFLAERGMAARDPWPSAFKFAGSQARIAAFIAVLGDNAIAVKLAAVVPYLAVSALVGIILLQLGSGPAEAAFAAAGFIGFGRLADLSVAGISNSTDALLFTVAVLALGRSWGAPRTARGAAPGIALPLCSGVFAGLLVLHRYSFVFFAPMPAVYCLWRDREARSRWRATGAAAAGTAIALGPFLLWSWAAFGALFPSSQGDAILMHRTRYLLYDPWFVLNWPSLRSVLAADPLVFVQKTIFGIQSYLVGNPETVPPWALVSLPLAIWGMAKDGRQIDRWVAAFVLVNLAVQLPISSAPRYQQYALPLVYVAMVRGWLQLARRWPGAFRKVLPVAGLAVLAVAAHGTNVSVCSRLRASGWRSDCRLQEDGYCTRDEVAAYLNATLPAGAVILGGDRPWDLALETRLRVLPLLPGVADLGGLASMGVRPAAIYLPAELSFSGDGLRLPSWLEWWHAAGPDGAWLLPGYRAAHRFSDGATLLTLRPGAPGAAPLDQVAILRRLQTRVVEFGTVRSSYHELKGLASLPGGGTRVTAAGARIGLHLPAGRAYRLRFTARGAAESSLAVGLHGVACGAFAVTREWATGDLTIPIAAVGAGGWCVVALNGPGVDLRRLEIQAAP